MSPGALGSLKLLAAVAALLGAFWFGVDWEQGNTAQRDLKASVGRENALLATIETSRAHLATAAAELARDRAKARRDQQKFDEELAHAFRRSAHDATPVLAAVCEESGPASPAAPGAPAAAYVVAGRVVCGPDCIRLWNNALRIGLPEAADSGGADGGGSAAGAAEAEDLFVNLGRNGQACNVLRSKLAQWRAIARREGWVPTDAGEVHGR